MSEYFAGGHLRFVDGEWRDDDGNMIEVSKVRHGRWLGSKHKIFSNTYDYVCSKCGCDYALAKYNYCPNCGAKLCKGEE